jgi:SAM-dependent methyltransferase
MEALRDVTVDRALIERTRRRFHRFIPQYLERHLSREDRIVSIGCGLGVDVAMLCRRGYDVYGIDPGARTSAWKHQAPAFRRRLRRGFAEDLPLGRECFDFAYALEVIEHVGCEDGVWKLLPNAHEIRRRFIESCLEMLRPGGRLLLSTSNRLCPVDVGHAHHYTPLTDAASRRLRVNLAVPWDRRNFVWSFGDVERCVADTAFGEECRVEALTSVGYPTQSSGRRGALLEPLAGAWLRVANWGPLRTSPLNPILVVLITRSAARSRVLTPHVLELYGAAAS